MRVVNPRQPSADLRPGKRFGVNSAFPQEQFKYQAILLAGLRPGKRFGVSSAFPQEQFKYQAILLAGLSCRS